MIQRAITKKNKRIFTRGIAAGYLTLSPQDFGVEIKTPEQRQEIKLEVEEYVQRFWGEPDPRVPMFSTKSHTSLVCDWASIIRMEISPCYSYTVHTTL
jgi:hypothetical protein